MESEAPEPSAGGGVRRCDAGRPRVGFGRLSGASNGRPRRREMEEVVWKRTAGELVGGLTAAAVAGYSFSLEMGMINEGKKKVT